jgi:hypothetical protein
MTKEQYQIKKSLIELICVGDIIDVRMYRTDTKVAEVNILSINIDPNYPDKIYYRYEYRKNSSPILNNKYFYQHNISFDTKKNQIYVLYYELRHVYEDDI